jgi:hypothetical protein
MYISSISINVDFSIAPLNYRKGTGYIDISTLRLAASRAALKFFRLPRKVLHEEVSK